MLSGLCFGHDAESSEMMYRKLIQLQIAALTVLLLILAGVRPVAGQLARVEFDAAAVCTKAAGDPGQAKVDFYVKVPYWKLGFEASPRGFVARYQVSAEIVELGADGSLGNKVEKPVWDRTLRLANHAETTRKDLYDLTTHSVELTAGNYLVELSVVDEGSGDAFVRELPIKVRNFNRPAAISDLLLLEEYDSDRNVVLPSVSNRFGTERLGFSMMYEVYLNRPQSLRISQQVFQTANTLIGEQSLSEPVTTSESVYLDGDTNYIDAPRSQHVVTIPVTELQLGQYLVRVTIEDSDGNVMDVTEETFTIDWKGLAEHIRDIDDAISQLIYIAQPKEIRHLKAGETDAERLSRFVDFWRRRDPTPGTRRNERMEEYYYRISHANERYGTLTDGWKTDRGEVVVLFGEPDYIERHPYNFNVEPYEIWYYYRIGKRFIFVDRTGLGDYEILIPIWDERTRIR